MSFPHISLFLLDALFSLNHVNLGLNLDLLSSLFCVLKNTILSHAGIDTE